MNHDNNSRTAVSVSNRSDGLSIVNRSDIEKKLDGSAEKLVANSQQTLIAAGMDLDGNNKVAFNEFRAAMQVKGRDSGCR